MVLPSDPAGWIAQLHPENVQLDPRLLLPDAEQMQIWEQAGRPRPEPRTHHAPVASMESASAIDADNITTASTTEEQAAPEAAAMEESSLREEPMIADLLGDIPESIREFNQLILGTQPGSEATSPFTLPASRAIQPDVAPNSNPFLPSPSSRTAHLTDTELSPFSPPAVFSPPTENPFLHPA